MTSPSDLAALDVCELVAVLPDRLPEPSSLEPHEWLYVVGMLASRIIADAGRLGPDEWTMASRAQLYALATAEAAGGIDHIDHVARRLNLTRALLDRVTADDDVAIRSPRDSLELLLDNLPVSLAEARRLAPRWRELEIPDIRRLRVAKNLLTPTLAINERVHDPRLAAWSVVYPQLP